MITEGPTSCAGNQGTSITFDDIFYNSPIRLKTLKFPSDEFLKIFDVTAKYAVHNHKLSFCLKKFGENNSIKTISSSSPIDIVRTIYGSNVASSLLDVSCADEGLKFSMNGFISKGDYSGKKRQFLLFINHRLVESKSLKRAIFDEVYRAVLPANVQPFVYLSIEMDPMNLDVNVSPTKHEVNFLNEDLIVEKIKDNIEERLLGVNETRKMYTQKLLPGASVVTAEKSSEEKVYAKDMVRTDSKTQTIVQFFQHEAQGNSNQSFHSQSHNNTSQIIKSPSLNRSKSKNAKPSSLLSSINELRDNLVKDCDERLREQIATLKFVGVASKSKALIQCGTLLYLCDTQRLCLELFYQQAVQGFENFDSITFVDLLDIQQLALIGFDMKECAWEETDGPKALLAEQVKNVLMDQRELLAEYFNIKINLEGGLETLPSLIQSFMPLLSRLPLLIIRLATEVNFDDEKECFKAICQELAAYYSMFSLLSSQDEDQLLAETIIYPEIRKSLQPPKKFMNDGTFLKLTSLPELYKVFERC